MTGNVKTALKATAKELDQRIRQISASFPEIAWENPDVYANWLAQQYFLVRHTTRFVALAAGKMPIGNRDAHYEMIHHLKGETNHDLLLLKDLKALGRDISEFTEDVETRLICNNQYYWLENGHPLAMLGYALMLEGFSIMVVPDVLKRILKTPSAKATAFLKLHTDSDEDHYPEGIENLGKAPEAVLAQIMANLEESWLLYEKMVQNCALKVKSTVDSLPTRATNASNSRAA